jgi:hypothetical protein
MHIIVLYEKNGERYINAGETDDSIAAAAAAVVRERISDGCWYDGNAVLSANYFLERNKAISWLRTRSTREYEGVSIQVLETLT